MLLTCGVGHRAPNKSDTTGLGADCHQSEHLLAGEDNALETYGRVHESLGLGHESHRREKATRGKDDLGGLVARGKRVTNKKRVRVTP